MNDYKGANMRKIDLVLWLVLLLGLAGCTAPMEPPRFGSVRTASAATYGVSSASPVAEAVLVQECPDDKTCTLTPYDTKSGAPVGGVAPLTFGIYNFHAFSPDGSLLATIHYSNYGTVTGGLLLLTDLESWTTVTATIPITNVYHKPVFHPDGTKIALLQQRHFKRTEHALVLLEIAESSAGKSAGKQMLDARIAGESALLPVNPIMYTFSGDGASLHLYGTETKQANMAYNPLMQAVTVDAETLEITWQRPLVTVRDGQYLTEEEEEKSNPNYWDPHIGRWWQPGRVFSRNGDLLYLVHADEERMTTVDFANRRVTARAVEERMGWIEHLLVWSAKPAYAKILNGIQLEAALNYDGSEILVTGRERAYTWDVYSEEYLPLRIIEAATGRLLTTGPEGTITPSGEVELRIFLHAYDVHASNPTTTERTIIADPATAAVLEEIDRWTILPARRLDGAAITIGHRYAANVMGRELAVLDPLTFASTPMQVDTSSMWAEFIVR